MFQGILFVLHTGIAWDHLPQELGPGSGMTCWRRLAEWTEGGVWPRLHEVLLAERRSANALGFFRAAVDGSHIRALGSKTGRSPVDRGRAGSKHHLVNDATGNTARRHLDRRQPRRCHPAHPPAAGRAAGAGQARPPRRRPEAVLGDRGYDHDKYRRLVWDLGVKPVIARRGTEHGSRLGNQRWVVERAFAHLH
ncbi:IS5 family transposase [Actinomadura keratinilytica]